MRGDVEVDDAVDVWDVQPAGRHVRGQQDRAGLGLELVESAETLVLKRERHTSVADRQETLETRLRLRT